MGMTSGSRIIFYTCIIMGGTHSMILSHDTVLYVLNVPSIISLILCYVILLFMKNFFF